jgi:hypothetical protein
MAVTATVTHQKHTNGLLHSYGTVNFDSSYPPGGEPVTANMFKLGAGDFDVRIFPAAGYTFEHNKATGKILAYRIGVHTHSLHLNNADVADGAAARVNAGANLLGANTGADLLVEGVADTTGHGGVLQNTASALSEVSSGVDLSAVVAKFEAMGAY